MKTFLSGVAAAALAFSATPALAQGRGGHSSSGGSHAGMGGASTARGTGSRQFAGHHWTNNNGNWHGRDRDGRGRDRDDGRYHRGYYPAYYYSGFYPYGFGYAYPWGYGYGYGYGSPYSGAYYNSGERVYQPNGGGNLVAAVQSRLARGGYYHGSIDGVIGSGTRRAIRAYERSHGLPVDGRIDDDLLDRMGLS
ncbi:MAG: peptidoglycan-binding protein [Verrucomicrobiota bacterium]|nr:peptidoglycan-binding protein [Verrucomicrobiota bacterium]